MGEIYGQHSKTTGPELEARLANATAKSDTVRIVMKRLGLGA